MSNARTDDRPGGYRTGPLWLGAGVAFAVLGLGLVVALFGMLEFDERCMQGMTKGPGPLVNTRNQAFPPATVCEFRDGDVTSVGGGALLTGLLWAALLFMTACVFLALLAECFEPPLRGAFAGELVVPMSRTEKVRRTGAAFFVTGSFFLMIYALAGWKLLAGPASACARGADWGAYAPRTVTYSFFPPRATCQYASGMTHRMNPDWFAWLTAGMIAPALLAGLGFVLAYRRRRAERLAGAPAGRPADATGADRTPAT
ncbi:hypothetical protein [Streptomyces sp. CBMA29]|uniref:hypothetical protein n=1 Tax=Streptomyces sp. CBMA29 TaxID=1896314 RepID=UPI001661D9FA|nr:hypothetical protein [Streptomyces sp. CBMA29]MBD0737177.1 hypothetical protein [Streptomyces sp. CBMA29]